MVLKRLACGFVIVSLSLFVCLSESSLWGAEVEILHNVIQEFVFQTQNETDDFIVQHRDIKVHDKSGQVFAEGGSNIHVVYKLFYNHPDKTSYEINPLFVKIISPLTMKNLNIHFDHFAITSRNEHYSGSLDLKFNQEITLEMELLVAKHYSSCNSFIYFAEITEFDIHPLILPKQKLNNIVSPELWNEFLYKVKKMTERYSFYILRKTNIRLGNDFSVDLCMIG